MARPLKESLDYFPLDIDFDQDDKLVVPLAKFGMQGLGIIVKIMAEVYRNGYFYPWTEREHYVFSNRVNVDINLVIDVINECIKWGFFNQKVYESYGVLTSKGFQKRYIEAAKRRKSINFVEDYLLIDPEEECKNVSHMIVIVNANGNQVNVHINPDKCNNGATQTPQSKVKESKVKKSSKEEKKSPESPPAIPDTPPPSDDSDKSGKGKKEPKYSEDNIYYRMACHFRKNVDEMCEREGIKNGTIRANMQSWANDFRLMVESDGNNDLDRIKLVMDWVVKDNFWKSNVMSAKTFREKLPRLIIDMNKGKKSGKPVIPVVPASLPSAEPEKEVSEEDYEAMMRFAAEQQAKKVAGGVS